MRISDWSSDVCSSDLGAEYAQRRTENCNVTDGIVARTDPHRAHVRIAFAIAEQQQRDDDVHDKRQRANQAHCLRLGVRACDQAVDRISDHPQAKREHGRSLEQRRLRSEEHTSELQSLMRISYAVFCLKKKKKQQ